MDAPSNFFIFFNLERKAGKHKQMVCLHLPDIKMMHDIRDMHRHALEFYLNLYTAEHCDEKCSVQLFQDLPQIFLDLKTALVIDISYQELTAENL